MTDILRFSYPTLLKRSKSKSYQQQMEKLTTVLMKFLKENYLIKFDPFKEDGSLKDDLVIHKSNLSEVGDQLFKIYYPKWSNSQSPSTDASCHGPDNSHPPDADVCRRNNEFLETGVDSVLPWTS